MRTEIIKCDRCGKEIDKDNVYGISLPYRAEENIYGYTARGRELLYSYEYKCLRPIPHNLCKKCMCELVDWMNGERE